MKQTHVVIFTEGGNYKGHTASTPIEAESFDWDDFKDDPVDYWESFPEAFKELLKAEDSLTFRDITEQYAQAVLDAAKERKEAKTA